MKEFDQRRLIDTADVYGLDWGGTAFGSAETLLGQVLAEVAARAHDMAPPASVPFFRNDDEESLFLRLRGVPMTD